MTVKLANNAIGYLATAINASIDTIQLGAGEGSRFPVLGTGEYFYATLAKSSGEVEIVKVTARDGDVLTATRAQEGTTGKSFAAGSRVELRITAATLREFQYPRTAAEIAAGVTPTTYQYEPGDVRRYGAVGDGSTDDYQAFADALAANAGGSIYVPDPSSSYLIGAAVTVPDNIEIVGQTRHVTKIMHGFNGNLFTLGDGATIRNLWCAGAGATYTGRCFSIEGSEGRQRIDGVKADDWDGEVVYFETNAGSQSIFIDCLFSRRSAGTGTERYAVVIDPVQQLSAKPRKFIGLETGGTCAIDFGGSNNTYVIGSFLGDIKFNAESRAVFLSGCRISNQAALTIDGQNIGISSCGFAPQITIASGCDAIALEGNYYNILPIIDNSGNGRKVMSHQSVAYTPEITSSGTAPSIGNGTISGQATRSGSTVTVTINFTVGSTTNLGTGELRFSLPTWAPCNSTVVQSCGQCVMVQGANVYTAVVQQVGIASQYLRMLRDGSSTVTSTSPVTWAAGDTFRISATYDV